MCGWKFYYCGHILEGDDDLMDQSGTPDTATPSKEDKLPENGPDLELRKRKLEFDFWGNNTPSSSTSHKKAKADDVKTTATDSAQHANIGTLTLGKVYESLFLKYFRISI